MTPIRPSLAPIVRLIAGLALVAGLLTGCGDSDQPWHATNMKGTMPDLSFTMTRASDGTEVTAADFKGKVTLLYFGYTFCPDVCPTTLANVAAILRKLGPDADQVRALFVTVDPNRDTLPVIKSYVKLFAPQIVGLRGNADQLAALARRYRVSYSVTPASDGHPYEVTHSSAVYVFDKTGALRLLISSLSTSKPDVDGSVEDLKRLIE
jgi:protein SCO1/2